MRLPVLLSASVAALLGMAVVQGAYSRLTGQAAAAICAENLRTLVSAARQYAEDHHGRLPLAVNRSVRPWGWWMNELFPYVEDMRSFYCPVRAPEVYDPQKASPLLPVPWNHYYQSYAYNMQIDLLQRKGEPPTFPAPGQPPRVLFVESDEYLAGPQGSSWPKSVAPRHEGKAHFALTDGSVMLESPGAPPSRGGTGLHQLGIWQFP